MPVRYQAALRPDKKSLNNGIMEHWNTAFCKEEALFSICLTHHSNIPCLPAGRHDSIIPIYA
jgi:hypothetical protein